MPKNVNFTPDVRMSKLKYEGAVPGKKRKMSDIESNRIEREFNDKWLENLKLVPKSQGFDTLPLG